MNCIKCKKDLPDGALFCCFCGKKQVKAKRKAPKRGNKQGTAYQRGNTWEAQVVIGYKYPDDPSKPKYPVKRRKGGFKTKEEAINACPALRLGGNERVQMTLQQVWQAWSQLYAPRIVKSTMAGYKAAYEHFHTLHGTFMHMISAEDLQKCMDECKAGKRTHQVMKVIAGLLWGYAYDKNIIDKDITKNLFTGHGKSKKRVPLTEAEVEIIRQAIGKEPYAEYVYCLCYLGLRPGEMLELRKDQLHTYKKMLYLVAGKKTDAGRDRTVPIPKQIEQYISERLDVPGTDLLFPMYMYNRKETHDFIGFKQMTDSYFCKTVFKPMMERLGIAAGKVPYCARHTYSDKLKKAKGTDALKASVMGHTDYAFTQEQYQSKSLEEYKKLANTIQ